MNGNVYLGLGFFSIAQHDLSSEAEQLSVHSVAAKPHEAGLIYITRMQT